MNLDSGSVRFMRISAVVLKIYVNFPKILRLRSDIIQIGQSDTARHREPAALPTSQ